MNEDLIVCKCEDITVKDIEEVIELGASTFDDIKRFTRCGMGHCQAKICLGAVNKLLATALKKNLNEIELTRYRIPLQVLTLEALATRLYDER